MKMIPLRIRNGLSLAKKLYSPIVYSGCCHLHISVVASDKMRLKPDDLKITSLPPSKCDHDLIGPPNPESNIRPTIYYIPGHDTALEHQFRQRRHHLYQWHHAFWAAHNAKFAKEKKQFTEARLHQLGEYHDDGSRRTISAEDMSAFYKRFLEENYDTMENYHRFSFHREWYCRNNSLTLLNLRVYLERAWYTLKRSIVRR